MLDGREDARNLRRRSLEVLRRQHPEGHGGNGQLGAPEEHVEGVPPVAVEDDAEVPRHRPAADLGVRQVALARLTLRQRLRYGSGVMRVFTASLTLATEGRTEVSDITKLVRDAVERLPVSAGIALVNTLHTTCALFVNEFQSALIDDLKRLIERLVPERAGYRHDDPRVSDCERGNAHSHLRAALIGRSIALGINNGELTLGRFQSIIFAELDGPRKREISVQVLGAWDGRRLLHFPSEAILRSCCTA